MLHWRGITEEHRPIYPLTHLSVHLSIFPFSQTALLTASFPTVTGSLTAREGLRIVGQEDDMSACQVCAHSEAFIP